MSKREQRTASKWSPCWAGLLLLIASATAVADAIHEGVASCAGGTCHAATVPFGESGIRGDEYFIWQTQDVHGKAFATLGSERSRKIGQALGISPQTDRACLSCHTESVPQNLRGAKFQTSDGIGCETCHGGAQNWLKEHTRPGLSLAEKERMGMFPTWRGAERAQLCLSCHQGNAERPITHAMMAAGHPPLLFELDTFTSLQPPHYDRDADYQRRKGGQSGMLDWQIGQGAAAKMYLEGLAEGRFQQGVFPELVHFDCAACHHAMGAGRAMLGRNGAAAIGAVPLADTHLHWLGLWLHAVAPERGRLWQQQVAQLQTAAQTSPTALKAQAAALLQQLRGDVLPRMQQQTPSATQLRQMLQSLSSASRGARAGDFATAQQAAMASVVFANALAAQGAPISPAGRAAIDALYAAARSADAFPMQEYHRALNALMSGIK